MNIDEILPKIIKSMELGNQVRPTVYAQVGASLQSFPIMHFEGDARLKSHLLFMEGRVRGLSMQDRELIETCFVSEVWMTQGQRNPTPGHKPPAHINQIEAVMLSIAQNGAPFQTETKMYRMKRDASKKVKSLEPLSVPIIEEGLVGVAFIAGWRSRMLSDEEVRERQPRGMRAFLV